MKYLPIILIVIIIAVLCFFPNTSKKSKSAPPEFKPKKLPYYDNEGFNRQGYNDTGRNRQGKYNRFYNVRCYKTSLYSEEGFLDIRENPLYLTPHAALRMKERMGIYDEHTMKALAFEAYQFGKSKFQLMKSERGIIEEKEQEHGCIILIYRGFCYVFTPDNGLKTLYKNERVRI